MTWFKKFLPYWLPPLFWMGLIYFLSSFHKLQASPTGWQDFIVRKTAHFWEYAILFVLYYRGFVKTTKLSLRQRLLVSFVLTFLYALSDEYHQTKVTGRTGRPFDIGIDSLGVIFGMIFSLKLVYCLPKKVQEAIL